MSRRPLPDAALEHYRAGRSAEAEALCRQALEHEPNNAGALHLLALLAQAQGRPRPAARLAQLAIASDPGVAHRNLWWKAA